jgi:hypothetical protein
MVAEEVGYFEVQLEGSDPDSESFFLQANERAFIDRGVLRIQEMRKRIGPVLRCKVVDTREPFAIPVDLRNQLS